MAKKKSPRTFAGLDGEYTYRFSGFNNDGANSHFINGLGWMNIKGNTIDGAQKFSRVQLNGVEPEKFKSGHYSISGDYTLEAGGKFGQAVITFTATDGDKKPVFVGAYQMRPVGSGRFWLISEGLKKAEDNDDPAAKYYFETASIEAVKVADLT